MDGKGTRRNNVFVQRLWRSVKYEEVYLHAYGSVTDARASIACIAIARCDSDFTIGIGAAVDRVLDYPVDGGVTRPAPGDFAVAAPRGQIKPRFVEPEQCLTGAAQFLHLIEDEGDGLLHPPVRILLQTIARLHEPHRRCNDQLAPARLLAARRERTLPQKIKLVFVEAALEAEQQAVIPVPWRIDRFLIDQNGIDDASHLDQLLPVAAVAREARDLPCCHGPDLAQANLRNHPLETGADNATSS
jgi:hypothetical protein